MIKGRHYKLILHVTFQGTNGLQALQLQKDGFSKKVNLAFQADL